MRKSILLGLFCFCCWTSYGQLQSSIFAQDFGGTDSLALEQSTLSGSDNNMRVKLDWKQEAMKGADYVSVERSSNGRAFEVITVLKQSGTAPLGSWIDEAPSKGTNLYRIRFNMPNGLVIYSRIVMVRVAGDISLKFYPNPVDDILIVRSEQPVDLQIMDASGKVRVQQSQVQGLSLLNVSALEKGIYLLRMQNRAYNLVKQVKLDRPVKKMMSGPLGGDQQIGAMIATGEIDVLIFFWDPMEAQPHDSDVKALLRLAIAWNILMACDRATADFLFTSPLMHDTYESSLPDYDTYLKRPVE